MFVSIEDMKKEIQKTVLAELSKQFPDTIFTDEDLLAAYEGLSDSWDEIKDEPEKGPWQLALTLLIFELRVKVVQNTLNNI